MSRTESSGDAAPGLSRRVLLAGGAAALGGAATAAAMSAQDDGAADEGPSTVVPFHGRRQAGVTTPPQAHAALVAFDLTSDVSLERFGAVMGLLSDDAARLTRGRAPLADTEPRLADVPARLTVTFGLGHGLFDRLGVPERRPAALRRLRAFDRDRLDEDFCGGDLLVQVCADDLTAVNHAVRTLRRDVRSIAATAWIQRGFRQAPPVIAADATPRNVMGQIDGTVNPRTDRELDEHVWIRGAGEGVDDGTTVVVRRIRAEMDDWERVPPNAREQIIGRRIDTGAPLTGTAEHDEPDFAAVDDLRLPVIAPNAHIRRARLDDGRRILRRVYNYDDGDSGLVFVSFQNDVATFEDVQARLDEADMLNAWATTIGSAEFYVPPGCEPGGRIGDGLLRP